MSKDKPKSTKWEATRFILLWILSLPFVIFREEIEALLAICLVVASLAIAVWSFSQYPDHWHMITIPAVALLLILFWPLLKLADKIEAHIDKSAPRSPTQEK